MDLEFDPIGNARRAELGRMTGRSSVPSIWINGEYVGGCDDGPTPFAPGVVDLAFAGTLGEKLNAAPASLATPPSESVSEEVEYAAAMAAEPEPEVEVVPESATAPRSAAMDGNVVPTGDAGVPSGFVDGGIF